AYPAIALIPVAVAAELRGQRCGGRGNNSAGRCKREQLQRDQRADHCVAPLWIMQLEDSALRALAPRVYGSVEALLSVRNEVRRPMRNVIRQRERHALALSNFELGARGHIPALEPRVRMQLHGGRPGDGAQPIVSAATPR